MAGDTIGCTARKKSKNKAPEKSNKSDNDDDLKAPVIPPKATRGGLRVYKIVMLGSGFVGKSGKFSFTFYRWANASPFPNGYIVGIIVCRACCAILIVCYVHRVAWGGLYILYCARSYIQCHL